MNARLIRGKTKGQSLPLIALMIVVLFAMVGLAVDVGNTYAEQRNTVRASNASALSGMNTLINGGNDSTVYSTIVKSLQSNGIRVAAPGAQPQSGERVLTANYLDAKGDPVAGCPNVGSCGSATPQGVTYIHVDVGGKVDTYFARVVGQNTLPVNANAWASRGPCATGVYPIVVRDTYLDQNGFINPDSRYSDDIYLNKTEKRIYLKENATPNGGFSFAKWKQENWAGNEGELENMLTGDGNLDERFNEAPWPSSNSLNLPMPAGYPIKPGQLNAGDWIYGNSGLSNGQSGSTAQLNWHIQNRTILILPIFDADNGRDGANGNYHVSRLGAFMLRGYGHEGGPGKGWYLDMVYIGEAKDCAVLVTNAPKATSLGILGQVLYRPRSHLVPQSRPPVQYDIVLDVSGSMSWTFAGVGTRNGNDVQCTGANANCVGGTKDRYQDQTQRRIYIAKQALNTFIDNMNTNDMMRIVTFSGNLNQPPGQGNDQAAINQLTKALPTGGPNNGWSSNKNALKAAVQSAGAQGDAYTTLGLTPSAVGLAAGNQTLSSAPTQAPDGQTYKRVVIFMTDGVANVFRDGTYNSAGGCGADVASCHVGYMPGGMPKPITAMGIEATYLKDLATIYVIALADVDETGLKNVASDQNYPFFSKALDGSQLPGILASIRTNVTDGQCVPTSRDFQKQFAPENASAGFGVTYPTVGYVTLTDQSGNPLPNGTAPVVVDQQTGNLAYRFSNMSPGTYQMSAWVGYKGDDNASRKYSLIFNRDTQTDDTSYTFQLAPSTALGQVVTGPSLNMDLNGVVCP